MITILGAGLSGCLAGIILPEAAIYEARSEQDFKDAPEHKAVLRFRTNQISQITGIPFKEVQVRKSIWYDGKEHRLPDIRFTNMYSRKVADGYYDRSIVNLDTVKRYIAPEDFHLQMLKRVNGRVKFGCRITGLDRDHFTGRWAGSDEDSGGHRQGPIISTIPMPVMAKVLGIESPVSFKAGKQVYVVRYRIRNANLNLSMYYPSPDTPVYRASIMKDILSIEMVHNQIEMPGVADHIHEVFDSLGISIDDADHMDEGQQLGKISYTLDEQVRTNWIFKLTMEYWIYSLGRFAIWKNILQDDVYNDVHQIRSFITSGTHYHFYKATAKA